MYTHFVVLASLLLPATLVAQSPFSELRSVASRLESAIRSQSEASNRPSMAMIDRETARSMNYDNQLKHVQTYYEKRSMRRRYQESERRPRRTSQQLAAASKRAAPDRLTVQQYDPYGGRINWPVVLRETDYNQHRQYLDKLFYAHAKSGSGIDTKFYGPIQTTLTSMREKLGDNYEKSNPDQWTYACKFIKSLQYEARFPVGS